MPTKPIPSPISERTKGEILDEIKNGAKVVSLLANMGVNLNHFYALQTNDPAFWVKYKALKNKGKNEHAELQAAIDQLTAELEIARKQLAEYAELLRWRLTEKEPPSETGYYEVLFPNLHGSYVIELWMPNEFINCDENEQPPYWRPIIQTEPDYENLP